MTTVTGKQLKSILSTVTQENMHSGGALGPMANLWKTLPDYVAGPDWVIETVDCADTLADWITEDRDYSLDDLQDITGQLADSETEDYYSNINKRVQTLSLWASTSLDLDVADMNMPAVTLTDLNSHYLYCAMRSVYSALIEWAYESAEELEESVA
jgi:hypothetical protein